MEHDYLLAVLKGFGFGDRFVSWVRTFYTDIFSCVKCNGFLTGYFSVERSVRQGCPLSALLYSIIAEPLSLAIKCTSGIEAVPVPGSTAPSLIYQYADDTTFTVSSLSSIPLIMKVVDSYCAASGAKVNMAKSELLSVGCGDAAALSSLPFKLVTDKVKVLGVYVGVDEKTVVD